MRWDDVNARARGLATHLLDEPNRLRLAKARTWDQLVQVARDAGYPLGDRPPDSLDQFDAAVGEVTAKRLALLGRWLGYRRTALAVVYEVEERQALRALLRGAVQGVSPAARLRSVLPTPALPRATLQQLARAQSPAELAALLLRHGHPAGRALAAAVADPRPPGLLGLELALSRTFAARATRAARRGGRILRAFASWTIDLENAWTVLQAPGWGAEAIAPDGFLGGGRVLGLERFTALARLEDSSAIRNGLAEAFGGSPFATMFDAHGGDDAGFERRALTAEIEWCQPMARLQPLGPAVVLGVLLRIRAEAHDLRAAAWRIALAAPTDAVAPSPAGAL
ncbi:MAG TPA: V-type ATPase subunit [Gemmatimonadales bacterium]